MSLSSSSFSSKEELGSGLGTPPPPDQDMMMAAAATTTTNSCSTTTTNNKDEINSCHVFVKGKRTKRLRLQQLLPVVAPPAATSASSISSTDVSAVAGNTTEVEEDMANCLILLSQGRDIVKKPKLEDERGGRYTSRRFAEAPTSTANEKAGGFYVYECKTCNKCFPSFQALGGHRASHKKPKNIINMAPPDQTMGVAAAAPAPAPPPLSMDQEKKAVMMEEEDNIQLSIAAPFGAINPSVALPQHKARVHECSICGSGFSSGQALGGHMRRHRPTNNPGSTPQEAAPKKENSPLLSLDLNLPAPSDDVDRAELPKSKSKSPASAAAAFPFAGKQQLPLMLSPSALVDCHY